MKKRSINKERLVGQTIGLAILMFVSKVLAFGRDMIISYVYGASAVSDAYNIANSVVVLLFATIAEGVVNAYIPRCTKIQNDEERNRFTNNLINITALFMGAIVVVGAFFSEQIAGIVGAGFSMQTKMYVAQLLCFTLVAAACYFVMAIINGYLNINKSVGFNGVQLIIINLCMIFCVISSKDNPENIGFGYMVSYLIPTFLAFILIKKYGYPFKISMNLRDARVLEVYRVALFAIIGTNVIKLNAMIDKMFASNYSEGTVTALNNGYTIAVLVPEIFVMALVTVIFPRLSQAKADNDEVAFYMLLTRGIKTILLIVLPITVLIYILAHPIIAILFERGAYTAEDTILTMSILRGYALGMTGISLNFLLCRALMAWKKEKLSALVLGGGMLVNIAVDYFCVANLGCEWIAMTTSMIVTVIALIFIFIFCKNANGTGYVRYKENGVIIVKIAIAAAIMAVVSVYVDTAIEGRIAIEGLFGIIAETMCVALCGMAAYIVSLVVLRVNILEILGVSLKRCGEE